MWWRWEVRRARGPEVLTTVWEPRTDWPTPAAERLVGSRRSGEARGAMQEGRWRQDGGRRACEALETRGACERWRRRLLLGGGRRGGKANGAGERGEAREAREWSRQRLLLSAEERGEARGAREWGRQRLLLGRRRV